MAKKKAASKKSPVRARSKKAVSPIRVIQFPVMEISQGTHKMFAFVAKSSVLRKISTVSRRKDDPDKGFQRHLKQTRLRALAKFVDDKKGVIPNNIILDFFDTRVTYDSEKSVLNVPNDICAWVVDGQHRLFGFEYAKKDYDLLVVGNVKSSQQDMVNMFITINTEQKRLPSSLCLDLLDIVGTEEDLNTRCRELVAKLQEEEDSAWYGLIDMTGEGAGLISLVNFVRKVKPLVSGNGPLKDYSLEEQFGAVSNYWIAIRAMFADQWGRSLLTKTLGFGALMNIFSTVFTKTLATQNGSFAVPDIIKFLAHIKDTQFDSDTLGSGAGNKSEMAAARVLMESIDEGMATSSKGGNVLKLR